MSRFERWAIWITAGLTTVSGLGLIWTKYFVQTEDPWSVINHPLEPWFLKAHIITAPLLIFAIGLIFAQHIWRHYRANLRRARKSGILTALFTLPMILSGYLIQVVTHEGWLRVLAIAHIAFGLIFAIGFVTHRLATRRRRTTHRYRRPAAENPERPVGHSLDEEPKPRRYRSDRTRKILQGADRK